MTKQNRRNLVVVVCLALGLVALGALYFSWAQTRQSDDLAEREARALATNAEQGFVFNPSRPTSVPEPEATAIPQSPAPAVGEVLVVNRVPGDDYGRLAIRHGDGSRTLLDRWCLRVHIAAQHGVCLSQQDSFLPQYETTIFRADNPGELVKNYASALPSRARVSPGGTFSAVTAFVTGTSYEDVSGEATTIVTIDEIIGTSRTRAIRQFTVEGEHERYQNLSAQYWGLTFADDDEFYITGFYGEFPEIMQGSLATMTVEPTGWEGSCPSLSPDAKTLVFKEKRADGGFDLIAIELATNERWTLNEKRSVDDQVEWLDNDTILYALHPEGGDSPVQPEFDIWMLDIDGGSEPVLFLPNADSPAVRR